LRDYQQKVTLLKQLSEQLTAGERDLPQLISKLYEENKSLRKDVSHLSEQVLRREAAALATECEKQGDVCVLNKLFENRSQNDLKALATAILDQASQTIVLFGSRLEGKAALVFSRTKDLSVNMNDLMKAACAVIGGRGGGPPHQAQGGGPDVEKLAEALQAATTALSRLM
jgi:alanyl-tRNA synthetase